MTPPIITKEPNILETGIRYQGPKNEPAKIRVAITVTLAEGRATGVAHEKERLEAFGRFVIIVQIGRGSKFCLVLQEAVHLFYIFSFFLRGMF